MAQDFIPKVITGNAVLSGDVVYLRADDQWTWDLALAEVLDDPADAEVRLLQAQGRAAEIVGAYLADVAVTTDGPRPLHFREDFRAKGPSNYFHGHQENTHSESGQSHV